MSLSVSKWEISEFGGYKALLSDYPTITTNFDIDFEFPEKNEEVEDLGWFCSSKLMKLFLLKVNEHNLRKDLVAGATIKTIKQWGMEKKIIVATPRAIRACLGVIIKAETELGNLFDKFAALISNSEFFYELPDEKSKDKDKDKGKGEGQSDDNEQDDEGSAEEKEALNRAMLQFINALEDTRKYSKPSGKFLGNDYIGGNLSKHVKFTPAKKGGKAKFTPEEDRYANHLVNMLDISFDPQSDKINSLKSGKLDACKIAEVVPGNTSIYYRVEENQTTKPFSVCILGDESGSMGGENIANQRKLIRILYKTFTQILPGDKIFIYGHSDHEFSREEMIAATSYEDRVRIAQTPGAFIYHDKYNQNFEESINSMKARGGNYDGPVIEAVYKRVREFTEDNIIFISISDGQPAASGYGGQDAIQGMKKIIEKCKRDGFVTIGIGFRYNGVKEIYNYNTIINDFKDMPKQVSGIVNQVVKTEFQS